MAKSDGIITSDTKNLTVKTESTSKTQFSCNLREKSEETTADGRTSQTACNFTYSTWVQPQERYGKESTVTRRLQDGKLVVEWVLNNVTSTRVYEKAEWKCHHRFGQELAARMNELSPMSKAPCCFTVFNYLYHKHFTSTISQCWFNWDYPFR